MAARKRTTVLDGESLIESAKLRALHGAVLVDHRVSGECAGTYELVLEKGGRSTRLTFTADGDLSAYCSMKVTGSK